MYLRLVTLIMALSLNSNVIFDFNTNANMRYWWVVNDTVMGGRSSCTFRLNDEGHGVFSGKVSLENNGGFSSIRHRFERMDVTNYSKLVLRVKGDGKRYQVRIKDSSRRYYSYISYIETNGEWQDIAILLSDMYPYFRGYELDRPNFNHDSIEEMSILIGNKKAESFELLIDKIALK